MQTIKMANLPPVARTLLIPLAYRAVESRRRDPLVCDERAVALLHMFDVDLEELAGPSDLDRVLVLMRLRKFDHEARAFLAEHPHGIVVDIGCGLDTRFERVDNGTLEWFGLDLPEVIELRRTLLLDGPRRHLIAHSALDFIWMDALPIDGRDMLFLAEGVLPYLEEEQVKRLVLALRDHFPGTDLVFDAVSTFSTRLHHYTHAGLKQMDVRICWSMDDSHCLEAWGDGIRLLEEWRYFDHGEPRLGWYNLLRFVSPLAKAGRIFHYRLG